MAASPAERAQRSTLATLEAGRFLAALAVVLAHLCVLAGGWGRAPDVTILPRIAPPGALPVQFFFVLSGFVMAVAHGGDRGRGWRVLPRFLWRRACRIYPMYWLALLLTAAFAGWPRSAAQIAALVSLWPTTTAELVPTAWTLRYEAEFYALFALVLAPRIGPLVACAWVLGTLINCFVPFEWRAYGLPPPASLSFFWGPGTTFVFSGVNDLFFAGVAAGLLHRRGLDARAAACCLAGGLALLASCMPWLRWGYDFGQTPFMPPFEGAGLAAILLGVAGLERAGVLQPGRWALRAGAMSYPLYVLHMWVALCVGLALGAMRLGAGGVYGLAAAALLAMLLASAVAAFAIDQPLQRRLRRLAAPPGPPTAFDRSRTGETS